MVCVVTDEHLCAVLSSCTALPSQQATRGCAAPRARLLRQCLTPGRACCSPAGRGAVGEGTGPTQRPGDPQRRSVQCQLTDPVSRCSAQEAQAHFSQARPLSSATCLSGAGAEPGDHNTDHTAHYRHQEDIHGVLRRPARSPGPCSPSPACHQNVVEGILQNSRTGSWCSSWIHHGQPAARKRR